MSVMTPKELTTVIVAWVEGDTRSPLKASLRENIESIITEMYQKIKGTYKPQW